jgi:DNA-3-methyladenine glycosylase II
MNKKVKTIKSHFKKADPTIHRIIVRMDLKPLVLPKKSTNFFAELCREIITQQLGSGAARAIRGRFEDLFSPKEITPEKVLRFADQELRDVGMSWSKVKYIKDLAAKTKDQEIKFDKLLSLDDESVISELTRVKGIGRWTAEMFLMFSLGREDVFSHGDLGLRKAINRLYDFKEEPGIDEIDQIVAKWMPYKTYGCLALWESIDK